MIRFFLTTVLIFQGGLAFAQLSPSLSPADEPGALHQHYLQNLRVQQTQPWLSRPVRAEDILPSSKPDIRFLETDISGKIMIPPVVPSPGF